MHCSHCNANLQGDPIPEEDRKWFGGVTHFGRQIGVEVSEVYDGILYYQCPDCGHKWHRFAAGSLHEKAKRYVDQ